jgi:spermidine/putrescine transport system ATP-binding protein
MPGGHIEILDLTKSFGEVTAVDRLALEIAAGEFFSLLGPSGCGKTTTLRMIAGFEKPTSGRIVLDGADMQFTPPYKRNVNTVFQSYALFPHLNVYDNVAFGLRRQRTRRDQLRLRVGEALELVQLGALAKRKPSELSGGQQQRVALARALVLGPAVLLLDEPLGALDAKLRRQLQLELKALQQNVGITFVYVTHDQEEALTMSNRIAVMNHGRVEQVAGPREVYEEPRTEFVADFLGVSNLMDAVAEGRDGDACRLRVGEYTLYARHGDVDARGPVRCVIRPERVRLRPYDDGDGNLIPGMVEQVVYLGDAIQLMVRLAIGWTLHAKIQNDGEHSLNYSQGTPVKVELPVGAVRVLRPAGTPSGDSHDQEESTTPSDGGERPATVAPASDAAIERSRHE